MNDPQIRLTSLAHGGGCGCKLAPSVLQQLLADQPAADAVCEASGRHRNRRRRRGLADRRPDTCVIATTDFFMPIVDDPRRLRPHRCRRTPSPMSMPWAEADHGARHPGHAAWQDCRSDSFAKSCKGAPPLCAEAGIPVAGGHSIDCPEPIYGLAVIGLCAPQARPAQFRRASAGDALILTKAVSASAFTPRRSKKTRCQPGRLQRDDRDDHAAEQDRRELGARCRCPRRHRRHRLRLLGHGA